jgi:hypothetical protein
MGMEQMALLSQAVSTNNPDNFVEAVKSVINIPLQQLTVGDFYYIVTYLRCNSFARTPLALEWTCEGYWYTLNDSDTILTAPQAREYIENKDSSGGRLTPHVCNTQNREEFSFDDIIIVSLPEGGLEFDDNLYAIPTANLVAEYTRLSADPKMTQLLPAVQWIKEGRTLLQKLEWLKTQGERDLDILDGAAQLDQKYKHGPSNLLIGKCTKCGTQVKQKFQLTAQSFFRGT